MEAAKLCEEGATDQELADYFGVDIRTLYRWKNAETEFRHALKSSKDAADDRVERSLFERATGYERNEVDIRVINNEVVQTIVRKWHPPDTTAAIFWLKNRDQKNWRDRTELTGADNTPLIPQTEPIELARRVAFMLHSAALQKES